MDDTVVPFKKAEIITHLEIKSLDEAGTFEGYGSIFGNTDSYGDVVEPGAFKDYLAKNKPSSVKLLWQHNTDEPIGYYEEIYEDEKGLYVKGKLLIDDIARAREAYALLKVKAINGLSIGFTIMPGGAEWDDKRKVRKLTNLSLWEISVVTFPANARAKVANTKEFAGQLTTIRDFENFLRDVGGFSKADATAIASHGFVKGLQRDAEPSEMSEEEKFKLSADINLILTALRQGVTKL